MKVYLSSSPTKRDFNKVPQIKIKNKKLEQCGFDIGKEYTIMYEVGKIVLSLIDNKK